MIGIVLLHHLQDETEAEYQFRQALSLNPHCVDAQVQLAGLFASREGKEATEEALRFCQAAIAECPTRDDVRVIKARVLTKLKRHEDAAVQLREALKINSANIEAHMLLAALLSER